jgi:hypothetical protein
MTDGCDDQRLARDMIDVHGREAATVAPGNARAAALVESGSAGEVLPGEGEIKPVNSFGTAFTSSAVACARAGN